MTQKEFEQKVLQMREKALAVAISFGFSPDEAEDVAQDVLLKLWGIHDSISADTSAEALAGVAARHCCIDKRRTHHPQEDIEQHQVIGYACSPHEQMEYDELSRWLLRQIEQLPSTNGIILKMRQLEHRELDEIAALLGIAKSSVSTLLSRARHQLLEQLKKRNQQ